MSDWHAPEQLLSRFARDPGGLDHATAASVEAHLVGCGQCRSHLRGFVDPTALEASWESIADRIDRPRPHIVERLMRRAGVREGSARLVSATAALSGAWLISLIAITAGVTLVSRVAGVDGPFLALAPLGPLAAVAVSFAAVADPSGEAGVATPMNGLSLVLRRAIVVLVPSFTIIGIGGLVVPGLEAALLWVLPALALSSCAISLAPWFRVDAAAAALAIAWITTLVGARWLQGRTVAYGDVAVFSAAGQVLFVALCLAAGWTIVRRQASYETLEVRR